MLAGPASDGASVLIHQDARLWGGDFDGEESASLALAAGRRAYVHVAGGALTVNGRELGAGDALMLEQEPRVELHDGRQAQVLVFDLP